VAAVVLDVTDVVAGTRPSAVEVLPESGAYVIFTSGTTGRPKGVVVSHHNVLRLFSATRPLFGFTSTDVWAVFHSFAFDFSVWEIWGALLHGGCAVVVPGDVAKDPARFRALLRDSGVTMLSQTPTAFRALAAAEGVHADRLPLKHVVFGGEALRFADLRTWVAKYGHDSPRLVNMYGITETTVHTSYRRVLPSDLDDTRSLIGAPLPDLDVVLVDESLRPVPDGTIGEIVVIGPGVTSGYLNRPDLTSERYVVLPEGTGRRGYRSGDLARRTPDGDLEYLGRADDQVKIRGFRIELGEIHAALVEDPGVLDAAVTVRHPAPVSSPVVKQRAVNTEITRIRDLLRGGTRRSAQADLTPRIVAHVVTGPDFDADRLFTGLRHRLPEYMLPAFVVPVDHIPMNRNNKVDRERLPEPTPANRLVDRTGARAAVGDGQAPDGDHVVRVLSDLFGEILGIDGVTADDSFFRIGGDSILALNLCAVAQERGITLELADVYALHTPRAIAGKASFTGARASSSVERFGLISDDDRSKLPSTGVEDAYPLGVLQAGTLFHSAYGSERNVYCDVFLFRLGGEYHHEAMTRAVERAVARHDILRTSFDFTTYSQPLQVVHESASTDVWVQDLRGLSAAEHEAAVEAQLESEISKPYDWSSPPLLRFGVQILADDRFVLWMCFHDALLDGWSEASVLTEILVDYWALAHGRETPPAARPDLRFADFVALEQAALHDAETHRFWSGELADVEPVLLPRLTAGREVDERERIGFLSVDVDPELSAALDERANALNVSLKQVLLAVHAHVVATLTGRDEVLLGVESNGRPEEAGGSEVLGTHLNVVPYRLRTRGLTWNALIAAAWDKERELLPVRRYPYAECRRLAGGRELTDILFNYTHFHGYERLSSTGIEVIDAKGYNQTNLTLRTEFNKDPFTKLLTLDLEGDLAHVTEQQLRLIADLYRNALSDVTRAGDTAPDARRVLGADRLRDLLEGFRGPSRPASAHTVLDLFDRSVRDHPDAVAARCRDESISYRDLAARAGTLAGWLAERGVTTGVAVGVGAGRDIDYLIAVLAIMRSGGVYLPLPEGPAQRVRSVLRTARPAVVLCDEVFRPTIAEAAVEGPLVVDLRTTVSESARRPPHRDAGPAPRDAAYIIFTSGSTGEPKGAVIRHDGMLNHVEAKIEQLDLGPADLVSQDAAATFDISVWQWIAPLAVGGTTVIYPDDIGQDPARLLREVATDGVTVLEVTPSVLSVFNAELAYNGVSAFPDFALRWVACQAETLTPQCANTFRRLLPGARLLNMWGTTEMSDDCTHFEVDDEIDERLPSVPIGRPIRNTSVYVLDHDRVPVPVGTPGELYVSGVCVGGGYLGDESRTAEVFVPDPFSGEPDALMYRTGDRGRQLPDGSLEFLNRVDTQLKVRGNRVELGEVRSAMAGLPDLQDSAVIARTLSDGVGKQLVGFFVPAVRRDHAVAGAEEGKVSRVALTPAEVRAGLAEVLPRYAIPDFLISLDELPRTPHGKLDVRALEAWDVTSAAIVESDDGTPATATETAIAEVWASVLGVPRVPPTASFFELGGHSLHATQVVARIGNRFGLALPVRVLFENPSVRALASAVEQRGGSDRSASEEQALTRTTSPGEEVPLSFSQSSLWFLAQVDPEDRTYVNGNLLTITGPLDVEALEAAFGVVVRRHTVLSTRFGSRQGVPHQVFDPGAAVRLEVEEVPGVPPADREAMRAFARDRYATRRFNLTRGPLAVAKLYRFAADAHVLEWTSHHIVSDGWSNDLVVKEVVEAYRAHRERRAPALPELPVQYADYAAWQGKYLHSAAAVAESDFWRSYLDGYHGELELVTDHERTEDRSRDAGYLTRTWPVEASTRIREFCLAHGTTPFMLFHAVTALIVGKLAQESDVVLGAAVAGRSVPGTEHLIGFFANTLPFRYHVDPDAPQAEFLRTVTDSALTAFEHQQLPFQKIVEAVRAPRTPGVTPLVQVFVAMDDYPLDLSLLPGLAGEREQLRPVHSLFDLVFEFVEADAFGLTLHFDSSLFDRSTGERLTRAFDRLLSHFLDHPDAPASDADLVDEQDRAVLARTWSGLTGQEIDAAGSIAGTVLTSPRWQEFFDRVRRLGLTTPLLLSL
jgi:amino acid adenylation domain-containing protein